MPTSAWIHVVIASGILSSCSVWPVGAVSSIDRVVGAASVEDEVDHPIEQRDLEETRRSGCHLDLAVRLSNHPGLNIRSMSRLTSPM